MEMKIINIRLEKEKIFFYPLTEVEALKSRNRFSPSSFSSAFLLLSHLQIKSPPGRESNTHTHRNVDGGKRTSKANINEPHAAAALTETKDEQQQHSLQSRFFNFPCSTEMILWVVYFHPFPISNNFPHNCCVPPAFVAVFLSFFLSILRLLSNLFREKKISKKFSTRLLSRKLKYLSENAMENLYDDNLQGLVWSPFSIKPNKQTNDNDDIYLHRATQKESKERKEISIKSILRYLWVLPRFFLKRKIM